MVTSRSRPSRTTSSVRWATSYVRVGAAPGFAGADGDTGVGAGVGTAGTRGAGTDGSAPHPTRPSARTAAARAGTVRRDMRSIVPRAPKATIKCPVCRKRADSVSPPPSRSSSARSSVRASSPRRPPSPRTARSAWSPSSPSPSGRSPSRWSSAGSPGGSRAAAARTSTPSDAFGPFAGFLTAWSYWISGWAGNAGIAVAWVGYVNEFVPVLDSRLTAVGATLVGIWLPALVVRLRRAQPRRVPGGHHGHQVRRAAVRRR